MGSADTEGGKKALSFMANSMTDFWSILLFFYFVALEDLCRKMVISPRFVWQSRLSIFGQIFLFNKYYASHSHVIYVLDFIS